MSLATLQQRGKDHYKNKDYAAALVSFDAAIGRLPSVQLLDQRAACHSKLNDLPAALKDAKKAIQLGREDPTGYLRAGKILVSMQKASVALEIYSHGLKCVKHVGKGYEALRKVHGELQSQLAPPKSIDPMTVLPRELARYVLEYLDFRQLIAICRVSKQWDRFIRSEPDLWHHLDLAHARSNVKSAFVSKCINTARSRLTAVTAHRMSNLEKSLAALLRCCPIEKLSFRETPILGPSLVDLLRPAIKLRELSFPLSAPIARETLQNVLVNSQNTLEVIVTGQEVPQNFLDVLNAPHLKSLALSTRSTVSHTSWTPLVQRSPHLETLKYEVFGRPPPGWPSIGPQLAQATNLTYLELRIFQDYSHQMMLPPTLRTLKIVLQQGSSSFFGNKQMATWPKLYLPRLETVELDVGAAPMEYIVDTLGLRDRLPTEGTLTHDNGSGEHHQDFPLSKIKRFCVTSAEMDVGCLGWSGTRLEGLEYLAVIAPAYNGRGDHDGHDFDFVAELDHLHTVDLSRSLVTGVAIKNIVSRGIVKKVIVNNCHRLSRDAVDWARSTGIQVENRAVIPDLSRPPRPGRR